MYSDQFDRIDQYLRGKFSAADASEFEAQLASDPALSEEFAMQKNIVEGIRHYRKQQLKQQLANVSVPEAPAWQSIGAKGLAVAIAASIVVVSTWYLNTDTESAAEPTMITMEGPQYSTPKFTLPELKPVEEVKVERAPVRTRVAEEVSAPVLVAEESPKATFDAGVVLPEDNSSASDTEFVPEEVSEEFKSSTHKITTEVLEVDNFDSQSEDLRYEYFDGKLALYGNFGDSPYQILEINQQGEKRLFLYHEDAYFAIANTSKPLPLVKIEDPEMIEELEIFKNEK